VTVEIKKLLTLDEYDRWKSKMREMMPMHMQNSVQKKDAAKITIKI